jgi:hypothetical protein
MQAYAGSRLRAAHQTQKEGALKANDDLKLEVNGEMVESLSSE